MQYTQRKLQRSVTEIRRARSGRPRVSRTPTRTSVENRRMAGIDHFLPEWDANEAHAVVLDATPERALAAALAAPAAPDATVRLLLRLRGLPRGGTIEELLLGMGVEPLARGPDGVGFR